MYIRNRMILIKSLLFLSKVPDFSDDFTSDEIHHTSNSSLLLQDNHPQNSDAKEFTKQLINLPTFEVEFQL